MHKKNKDKLLTMPQEEGTQNQSTEELSADMCKLWFKAIEEHWKSIKWFLPHSHQESINDVGGPRLALSDAAENVPRVVVAALSKDSKQSAQEHQQIPPKEHGDHLSDNSARTDIEKFLVSTLLALKHSN